MTPLQCVKLTAEAAERGRLEAQSKLDAALAREAALREELATAITNHRKHAAKLISDRMVLKESLTAAEQRNAELVGFMARVEDHFKFWHDHTYAETLHGVIEDYRKTKPTESGASE